MRGSAAAILAAMLALASPATYAGENAAAQATSDDARSRLARPAVLRGGFEQRKQLQGFRNPLVSRGRFLLLRDRGVIWDTTEPFASSTVLTRDRLLTRQPDGSTRVVLDAAVSPAMASVNSLLLALVAGDLEALAPQFGITETLLPDGRWQLRLQPREAGLRRVFRVIELRGDEHVREVVLEETGGDLTMLRFLGLSDEPATASADEAARFD